MTAGEHLRKPGWKFIGAILLLGIVVFGARAALEGARRMAFFRVRTVEVRGARYLDPREIVRRLQIDTLTSLWDDLDPLLERVRVHPQVTSVEISRKMPGTLVVTLQENLPVALIPTPRGLLPFDSLGTQLPIDPLRTDLDLPVVATRDPVLLKLVGAIRRTEPRVFARMEEVRRTGRDEILITLSRSFIDLSGTSGDSLALRGKTLRVRVPVGLSVDRLADIFPVESDLERRQAHVGELDLRYRDQVIARLQ